MGKNFRKIVFLTCMSACLLGCNKNTRTKKDFNDVSTYVANNYDINALDNVEALYQHKINKLNIDLNVVVTSASSESEFAIRVGFDGVKFQAYFPVVTFNTYVLGYTRGIYNQLSQASMEFITDIGTDLNYYLDNGCLDMAIESSSNSKIANIVGFGLSAINIIYYSSRVPQVRSIIDSFINGRFGGYVGVWKIIRNIVLMGIGLGADSNVTGKFATGIKTNKKGYINDIYFKTSASNVDLYLTSNSFTKLADDNTDVLTLQNILPQYNYHVTGDIEMDFEISNNA